METTTTRGTEMKSETMTMNAKKLRFILEDAAADYRNECDRAWEQSQIESQRNGEFSADVFEHSREMHQTAHQLQTLVNMIYRLGASGEITITFSK